MITKKQIKDMRINVDNKIKDNPYKSILMGAGVGILIGVVVGLVIRRK